MVSTSQVNDQPAEWITPTVPTKVPALAWVAAIVAHQGDPMTVAASTACLNILNPEEIARINAKGHYGLWDSIRLRDPAGRHEQIQ